MDDKKNIYLRLSAILGSFTPIILFLGIFISIYFSSDFSWTKNFLSELAGSEGKTPIYSARGFSSLIFNISFILAGIFGTIFSLGLIKSKIIANCLCGEGSFFLILNMLFLTLVGIFPLTVGFLHILVSYGFFLSVPIFLLIIGYNLRKTKEKKLGLTAFVLGIITVFSFAFFPLASPWGQNAIVEMIIIVSISIFIIIFSLKLLIQSFN